MSSLRISDMLDGCALASVRVARGLESVLWVGSEFVVLVLSVVRHVDINLARSRARYATRGVVSSARTSAHRSAKETRHTVSEGWSTKNVFGRLGSLHKSPAQEGRTPWYTYLTLKPNVHEQTQLEYGTHKSEVTRTPISIHRGPCRVCEIEGSRPGFKHSSYRDMLSHPHCTNRKVGCPLSSYLPVT